MKHADLRVAECHAFQALGQRILLNVETSLFYAVNNVSLDLVGYCSRLGMHKGMSLARRRYRREDVEEAASYLASEGFFTTAPPPKPAPEHRSYPLRTLELCVTHGCNLACRYCYGRTPLPANDASCFLYGASTAPMSEETAFRGIDYLFANSGRLRKVHVTYFGGEPLLNFPLIKAVTRYCRAREKQHGKEAELSVVTNGVLLDEERVHFFNQHRVSVQVSMDGPKGIHDANRSFRDGSGSYDVMLPGVKQLLKNRNGRVPVRATAAHGALELRAVLEHLLGLGFRSVHIEPALGGDGKSAFNEQDLDQMLAQEEEVAALIVDRIQQGEFLDYHSLVRHVRATRLVRDRRYFFCGAGRGLLCLSNEGKFYPCHRFAGIEEYCLGDLDEGIDESKRAPFRTLHVGRRPGCRTCWARYFCGGGCWKHAHDAHGGLEQPDEQFSCRIVRRQTELAMAINAALGVTDQEIVSGRYEAASAQQSSS
ncbi:MAG: SPASM domain-containing protein [Candidatus Hydrogenedentes bacterium]|nr:SPASM domain-containing protein [Candidatus Hydrogenedentota bacterium]